MSSNKISSLSKNEDFRFLLKGKKISIKSNFSLFKLLQKYNLSNKKIAVEHNGKIVPKTSFKKGIKLTLDWYFKNKSYYKSISKKDIVNRLGKG